MHINEKDIVEFVKSKPKPKTKVEVEKAYETDWKTTLLIALTALMVLATGVVYALETYAGWRVYHEYQSPVIFRPMIVEVEQELMSPIVEVAEVSEPLNTWTGTASYYSWDGCVGCNPERIMANGEVLDDMRKTLAFNQLPMNTVVVVTNLSNGEKTEATVTDTGGFNDLGRIADLSVATKEILGCNDLCQIRVEEF